MCISYDIHSSAGLEIWTKISPQFPEFESSHNCATITEVLVSMVVAVATVLVTVSSPALECSTENKTTQSPSDDLCSLFPGQVVSNDNSG